MSLNATAQNAQNTFNQIQNTCNGVVQSASQVFTMYHAGSLTYERIYNDFIPKVRTAINALPASEEFPAGLESSLDAYALIASGAESYSSDYKALEILLDELLVMAVAAVPADVDGYVKVVKISVDGSVASDAIPEMLEISGKIDQIVTLIG
jgi:hypothetical protein